MKELKNIKNILFDLDGVLYQDLEAVFGQVSKKINQSQIIKKIKILDQFYKRNLKKKPKIAILGINPHNFSSSNKLEKMKIIKKAVSNLKKRIKVFGPLSPDSSFMPFNKSSTVTLSSISKNVLEPPIL